MDAGIGRDGADQRRRLAADDHQCGHRALLEPLDGGIGIEVQSLDLDPERLEQRGRGRGGGRSGGSEIHLPAGELGHAADIGPGEEVNLLRREPGDQLELFAEGFVLGRFAGQSVGRDEGQVDPGIVKEGREIAGAGIAQHGEHAKLLAVREQASHVGRQHGFGGGGSAPAIRPSQARAAWF